jgi:hypothetical protein
MRVRKVDDRPVDTKPKCCTCLWYTPLLVSSKIGECKNAESGFYCDQGDSKGTVQIASDADACRHYKVDLKPGTLFSKDSRTIKWLDNDLIGPVLVGLYQLLCMVTLTGVFFYTVFWRERETYTSNYSRTEKDKLLY